MASASVEFQDAVLAALKADAAVGALAGDRIYDKAPGLPDFPYITFGPSDYIRDDMDGVAYRIESLQLDVWARSQGRMWPARQLADAVADALHLASLDLATNALAKLRVDGVRVMGDPDGITSHGVVTLEAEIEQR